MVVPPCRRRFRLWRACDELALAPGRLDSLAALYQGGHRREAPALRDMPYGSAHALNSSPAIVLCFAAGCRPLVGRSSLRVYPDQHTTSPAPALGSVVVGRGRSLVRIRAPLVRCVLLPGAVDMPANSLMSDSVRHTMSGASRSIGFRISSRRLQDPGVARSTFQFATVMEAVSQGR